MRLSVVLPAIAMSVAAACDEDAASTKPSDANDDFGIGIDGAPRDATLADASADDADAADATLDSYVAWCEAGPPTLIADGGCGLYFDVPCGLPSGLVVDDAGTINRCDQICIGAPDDLCAELPPWFTDVLLDAGLIDSGTAATLDAGAAFVVCACQGSAGRRPEGLEDARVRATSVLGAFFSRVAHLERASVHAFARLRAELTSVGAPRALVDAASRAIADEKRHARETRALAHRFDAPVAKVRRARAKTRSVEAIATENAVEGCVRETFGALVATWQARHARDQAIRTAFTRIARDETRHAELAREAARFFDGLLDDGARARVEQARIAAFDALALEARRAVPQDLVATAGLPNARASAALVLALRHAC